MKAENADNTKRKPGRPKGSGVKREVDETGAIRLPQFVSMGAMSAATGIPVSVMKVAKRGGCGAFGVSGRVDLGQFLAWHFSPERSCASDTGDEDDPSKLDWDTRKRRADALYQEEKLLERQMRAVPIDILDRLHQRVGVKSRLMLEKKLCVEAPPRVADRGITMVRGIMEEICGEVCACMADGLSAKALAAEVKSANKEGDDEEDGESG